MPQGILKLQSGVAKLLCRDGTLLLMVTDPPRQVTDQGIASAYAFYATTGNGAAIWVGGTWDTVPGYGDVLHI